MRATGFALLAATALAFGGCGGSDDGSERAPTRAQFVASTDRRCEASTARTRALNAQLRRAEQGARDDEDLLRRIAPILQRGSAVVRENADALGAEQPPPADRAAVMRIRAAYDEQAAIARRLATAAKQGDVEDFKSLIEEQRDVLMRARSLARDYGFRECGSAKSDAG